MKTCSHCKILQSLDNFVKDRGSKDGHTYLCKPCRKNYRSKQAPQRAQYYKNNRQELENKRLLYKYGISLSERERLLRKQDFKCAICFLVSAPLVIDHCHKTGKIRELLCMYCNLALGGFKDNHQILLNATKYLQKHKGLTHE